ncbi:MAG: 23S rRNA (pseudouridine(1915)-N(3))-methyltransferase RlmH [Clostridiales bacterium]|nr:23S rRNA (pseudouridine(1915)-N(3))-methyltransferase RlmH [Clostridiales bacterium]MCD7828450.1 23S rRNA (pseudouridine(1915)-N(3))-methyltransferase RlmH [Clostridiales bacterium]
MQKITIVCVGKLKDAFYRDASEEYLKRLKAYCKAEIIEIQPVSLPENPSEGEIRNALETEGDRIIKKIPPNSTAVAMCVEGETYSSEDLARLIGSASMKNGGSVTFVIGGSYGLSDKVKNAAQIKMSASKMTFPHRLFRVMLLEQIYRAFTIINGGKYHK